MRGFASKIGRQMQHIDKQQIVAQIIQQLEVALDEAKEAADQAHNNATHSESAAETQYDTLGLENAYLAHGQSMRAQELLEQQSHYKNLALQDFAADDEITVGALVKVGTSEQDYQLYFLGPAAGGLNLASGLGPAKLITPNSPIGQHLIGNYQGDSFELNGKLLTILAIY